MKDKLACSKDIIGHPAAIFLPENTPETAYVPPAGMDDPALDDLLQ